MGQIQMYLPYHLNDSIVIREERHCKSRFCKGVNEIDVPLKLTNELLASSRVSLRFNWLENFVTYCSIPGICAFGKSLVTETLPNGVKFVIVND